MEVCPARHGIDWFSQSGPMFPNAGQDNQAQEKHRNHLLISLLNDGLTLANPMAQLLITG